MAIESIKFIIRINTINIFFIWLVRFLFIISSIDLRSDSLMKVRELSIIVAIFFWREIWYSLKTWIGSLFSNPAELIFFHRIKLNSFMSMEMGISLWFNIDWHLTNKPIFFQNFLYFLFLDLDSLFLICHIVITQLIRISEFLLKCYLFHPGICYCGMNLVNVFFFVSFVIDRLIQTKKIMDLEFLLTFRF